MWGYYQRTTRALVGANRSSRDGHISSDVAHQQPSSAAASASAAADAPTDARGRRQLELTGSTAGCSTESAREGKLARRSREPNVGKLGQSDMWEATRRDKSLPSARCS
jgi:hypothetical protein